MSPNGGVKLRVVTPVLPADLSAGSREVLDAVWESYKSLSAIKLSNMTHSSDGPWRNVLDQYKGNPPAGTDIPMTLIRTYFKSQLKEDGEE
jgi:uncharacterized phage-associated protein